MLTVLISTDTRYPVNRKMIRKAVSDTFQKHQLESLEAEVSVSVVGQRKMKELTDKYLGDGKSHEVLSFPLEEITLTGAPFVSVPDNVLRLGDVVLCWPQVLLCASEDAVMVDEEVYRLTAHGVEHLLGEHHE